MWRRTERELAEQVGTMRRLGDERGHQNQGAPSGGGNPPAPVGKEEEGRRL